MMPAFRKMTSRPPKCFLREPHDGLVVGGLRDVQLLVDGSATVVRDLVGDPLQLVFAPRSEDNLAPSFASSFAVASPIPDDAPVMTTTLFSIMLVLRSCCPDCAPPTSQGLAPTSSLTASLDDARFSVKNSSSLSNGIRSVMS
jgi:hypothetical protein